MTRAHNSRAVAWPQRRTRTLRPSSTSGLRSSAHSAGTLDSAVSAIPESAYCAGSPAAALGLTAPSWNGWGVDLAHRRYQPTPGLTANEVPRLRLRWAFGFPNVSDAGSQATVVDERMPIGTRTGLVYALDASTGRVRWVHEAPASVRSAISVGPAPDGGFNAYVGDALATAHAVDVETGTRQWSVEVHPAPIVTAPRCCPTDGVTSRSRRSRRSRRPTPATSGAPSGRVSSCWTR